MKDSVANEHPMEVVEAQKKILRYVGGLEAVTKKKAKVSKSVLSVEERWERGLPHNKHSTALARKLADIDNRLGNGQLDLKFGGDGDNGEHLLYLLDIYFETMEVTE
jgi:hypothetical protein